MTKLPTESHESRFRWAAVTKHRPIFRSETWLTKVEQCGTHDRMGRVGRQIATETATKYAETALSNVSPPSGSVSGYFPLLSQDGCCQPSATLGWMVCIDRRKFRVRCHGEKGPKSVAVPVQRYICYVAYISGRLSPVTLARGRSS